jgi:GTPase SAR1 family protein
MSFSSYTFLIASTAMGYCRSRALPVRHAFGVNCSNPDTSSGNRSVTRSYYRGAAGVILVYDITKLVHLLMFTGFTLIAFTGSRDSFLNMAQWLTDARALASPHLVAVLVGNKSDREDDREVEWAEASRWAAENGNVPSVF